MRRGLYIPVPVDAISPTNWSEDAVIVADAIWQPCYFTGWTAASHWGLTEQVFRTTVLKTTRRVRTSSVRLLDQNYLVSHAPATAMQWGLMTEWRGETRLKFADPARTVIDILDAPSLAGGIRHGAEILAAFLDSHDPATLIPYGDRLGNRAVFKRLGHILEALGLDRAEIIAACKQRVSAGISPLDPEGPPGGRRISRWGLRVNVHLTREEPS